MIRLRLALVALAFTLPMLLVTMAAAQDAYRIRAGDVLRIEVIEDPGMNRSTIVLPDGRISMPLAGSIAAAGRSVDQVQAALAQELAPNFASPPSVFVSVERLFEPKPVVPGVPLPPPTVDVFLVGEFATPGKLEVAPGTTVLQLFAQAKGFTRFAATKRLQLQRTQRDGTVEIYPLNYDTIISGQSPNGRVVVQKGDVFVAPVRGLFE